MREIRFTANSFVHKGETGVPDAVLDEHDLAEIQRLAGINSLAETKKHKSADKEENISHTAMKRVDYMKKHNIKPGSEAWFELWFSRPYLTGITGMKK